MQSEASQSRMQIFTELVEISLQCNKRDEALQRLTRLVRAAMDSDVCNLALLDAREKLLLHAACARSDQQYEEFFLGRPLRMGTSERGDNLDYNLFMKGEGGARYNLQEDGHGIIYVDVARKYHLNSAISAPLKLDGRLIGYLNHFTSKTEGFSEKASDMLNLFARHAELIIDRVDKAEYNRTLERSNSISFALQQSLMSVKAEQFLKLVPQKACALLEVPICLVWKLNQHQKKLTVVATAGDVDPNLRRTQLDLKKTISVGMKRLLRGSTAVGYLSDVSHSAPEFYQFADKARAAGWVSLLTAPMRAEGRLVGMLDVYTKKRRYFKRWEKEFFRAFANYTAFSIHKTELLRE